MLTVLRTYRASLCIVGLHLLALGLVVHFHVHWQDLTPWAPKAEIALAAALLIGLGADLGLLGLWTAARVERPARWLATVACLVCWCGVYDPGVYFMLRHWSYFGGFGWQYGYYLEYVALAGLVALVILALTGALFALGRRGARLKLLTAEELSREVGARQFQIAHVLLLVTVLSLLLAGATNGRQWLSEHVSMRWNFAAYAPVYSAETVIFSAFLLVAITLTIVWAVLSGGRPWLRLAMALLAAALFGFAWALSFTNAEHQDQLIWNGLFSAGVGLLQAVLMSGALLIVRSRGYRLVR